MGRFASLAPTKVVPFCLSVRFAHFPWGFTPRGQKGGPRGEGLLCKPAPPLGYTAKIDFWQRGPWRAPVPHE